MSEIDEDILGMDQEDMADEIMSLRDEIKRISKELGDAGVLITQGPRDGVVKLINERNELLDIIANTKIAKAKGD